MKYNETCIKRTPYQADTLHKADTSLSKDQLFFPYFL